MNFATSSFYKLPSVGTWTLGIRRPVVQNVETYDAMEVDACEFGPTLHAPCERCVVTVDMQLESSFMICGFRCLWPQASTFSSASLDLQSCQGSFNLVHYRMRHFFLNIGA